VKLLSEFTHGSWHPESGRVTPRPYTVTPEATIPFVMVRSGVLRYNSHKGLASRKGFMLLNGLLFVSVPIVNWDTCDRSMMAVAYARRLL
jgi:hypothetical protein